LNGLLVWLLHNHIGLDGNDGQMSLGNPCDTMENIHNPGLVTDKVFGNDQMNHSGILVKRVIHNHTLVVLFHTYCCLHSFFQTSLWFVVPIPIRLMHA